MIDCGICGLTTFDEDRRLPIKEDPFKYIPFAFELDCGHWIMDGSEYPILNGTFVEDINRPSSEILFTHPTRIECWRGASRQTICAQICVHRRETGQCGGCWEANHILNCTPDEGGKVKRSWDFKSGAARLKATQKTKELEKEKKKR